MTMTPEPTDKLDATTHVAVSGPAGDALPERADRTTSRRRTCQGLLEPDAGRLARPVVCPANGYVEERGLVLAFSLLSAISAGDSFNIIVAAPVEASRSCVP